jgi:hypothetical protein
MRKLVLALATLTLASLTVPVTAAPREGTRTDAERLGDLFIPIGAHPPTSRQRRADPDLIRYPGLTPREPGFQPPSLIQQIEQMRDKSNDRTITIR